MKRLWGIATALALAFPFAAMGQTNTSSYYDRSFARMSFVQGDVYVQRAQDQGFAQGEVNLVVVKGDKIGCKDGRLEIQLGRQNYLRLDRNAQVDLVNLPERDLDPTKLHLLAGSIYLRVGSLDREKNIEIHTPDASFYILSEGLYRVDIRENRETEFGVDSGSAEAAGEEGSSVVSSGQTIVADNGRFLSGPSSLQARRDDFGSWNESREGLYAKSSGRTYLPAEYSDYEPELAANGRWVEEEEYGNVWVPNVASYSDWRPYSYGRWEWYPLIGWTWISSDSWGWCTHHYGRWGWGSGLGWYWIPRGYMSWGPAWVNWWNDDYYIGWCPLSYWGYPGLILNNRFYGRYNYGDHRHFRDFERSMTMVGRGQLQNRQINRFALGADRLGGRVDAVNFRNSQPGIRPTLNRDNALASRAGSALSRQNMRSVDRSFTGGGRSLSGDSLRSTIRTRSGDLQSGTGSRNLSGRTQEITPRSSSRTGSGALNQGDSTRRIRTFPSSGSRNSLTGAQPSTRNGGSASSSTIRRFDSGGTVRSFSNSSSGSARGVREFSSGGRISGSPAPGARSSVSSSRNGSSSTMRSYPSRRTDSSAGSGTLRNYSAPSSGTSRTYSAPSRSYSGSSRTYSAPSRSYSSPSARSYSAPSRSYSGSSRTYSAPSRSYSSPSRSYSNSSRSYSGSSRSYSAPSRSYSSSSRSSSGSSRSYGSSSRSSSGSGSSRSSSSSSRSSGGSSRHR